MQLRELGNTGLQLSPIGFGTVKLGRDQGVKYPQQFRIPDDREAADLLTLAKELGINLLDTAPAYGNSEERLGKLLKGQREQWLICSKTGEEFDNGESSYNFSASHTRKSIERSLQRLNTDYIDIVLIHSNGDDERILREDGAMQELLRCKEQGLIRAVGMSTKTVAGGKLAAELGDAVMATYNPAHTEELPVLDYCAELGKGVLVKKALASGYLCTDDKGGDPVQQALELVLGHSAVCSTIIGTINPEHLRSNVEAAQRALAAL